MCRLVPQLLGAFIADDPAISVTVEEISSTEIETALEEGRMDVGLGFLTRHSPNLSYERLCTDQFALIVAQNYTPWANRRVVDFSKLHQQRLLRLPDSFVMRRMSDEICRKHMVRPHMIAEINAIETLLRSLGPSQAAASMPKIALPGREPEVKAIRLRGKNLGLDIGLLRLSDSATPLSPRSRASPRRPFRKWSSVQRAPQRLSVILSEAKNPDYRLCQPAKSQGEMFESLASCFAFRCSAPLNMAKPSANRGGADRALCRHVDHREIGRQIILD